MVIYYFININNLNVKSFEFKLYVGYSLPWFLIIMN